MVTSDVNDTIVAIASPPGGSWRGIIRISGPATLRLLVDAFELRVVDSANPTTVETALCLGDPPNGGEPLMLPGRLMIWPDHRSYTRQPSAEFHTLGSPPLLNLAVSKLTEKEARQAQKGEFTLRAFLSGRIDLTQAEAVLSVIDAQSSDQLDQALVQLAGGLAGPMVELQSRLIGLLAELEAGLDFVEEDIEFVTSAQISAAISEALVVLRNVLDQLERREVQTQEVPVVLVGLPNAGKSSLFNHLANDNSAIVSDQSGTTRDFLKCSTLLGNHAVQLIDTAGVDARIIESEIDDQAQKLAKAQAVSASIRVLCHDVTLPVNSSSEFFGLTPPRPTLLALTKVDLLEPGMDANSDRLQENTIQLSQLDAELKQFGLTPVATVLLSCKTGAGLDELIGELTRLIETRLEAELPMADSTGIRARRCLECAEQNLRQAEIASNQELGQELVASEIRQALNQLAEVVGKVYTDDILDQIFSRFCIGK